MDFILGAFAPNRLRHSKVQARSAHRCYRYGRSGLPKENYRNNGRNVQLADLLLTVLRNPSWHRGLVHSPQIDEAAVAVREIAFQGPKRGRGSSNGHAGIGGCTRLAASKRPRNPLWTGSTPLHYRGIISSMANLT